MKRAPAPNAKATGETGVSTDPSGVDGDRVPALDVGEYCPLREAIDLIVKQKELHIQIPPNQM